MYLREVGINEQQTVTVELIKSRTDGSRWSIRHEIFREDGVKAAIINVDGAWLDLHKRKLTVLPEDLVELFKRLNRSPDYQEE